MRKISLDEKIRILEKSRNRLKEELTSIEQESYEKEESLKNIVLLLASFVHDPKQPKLNTYLEELKSNIKSEPQADRINNTAKKIKASLLNLEEVKGASKTKHRTEKVSVRSKGMSVFEVLTEIIFKLKMLGDKDLKKELEILQDEIHKSFSESSIPKYIDKITIVIQEFKDRLYKVHPEIESFVDELIKRLIKTEAEIKNMLDTQKEKHQSDIQFSDKLESELKTMEKSFLFGEDLKKIKNLVFKKLKNITGWINQKKALDEKRHRRIQKQFTAMEQQITVARKEVKVMEDKSKEFLKASLYDELTGIFNRKGYSEEFNKQWNVFQRYDTHFSLVIFDIDDFKPINDTYGHKAGDTVLQEVAKCAKKIFRNVDIPTRYGGDEFIVILPNTGLKQAIISAERMRKTLENINFRYRGKQVEITISTGVASVNKTDTPETFFEKADRALYIAKSSGKNQTQSEAQ